ncbi:odorant receptor 94a-like [Spodoptera frugiperda]|uniref:Odorant receptor n=1 Tax=Spodoptera frugiperda TaxID=7108 RepID=A0A9R0E321_SPOFR|nr:odorant receptor 94a-like [Spodoptera frugiperda]
MGGSRNSWDDVFDSAMIEIPQFNLVVKAFTVNLYMSRIDRINNLLKNPIFAAKTKKDEEMLLDNMKTSHRLVKYMIISILLAGVFWSASFFAKRYQDPTAVVYIYTPFETVSWTGYSFSVMMEILPLPWTGFGHLGIDCLIATYYAQAEVQLKIIKYNLEHLFDTDGAFDGTLNGRRIFYVDQLDRDLRGRFVHLVQRYAAVTWYTKEVSKIFNHALAFEFFSSAAVLCMVTFKMSYTPMFSLAFAFFTVMLGVLLMQVLLYCYFGNMVQYESDSIITSVYLSDWLSASPRFRRDLLIAMQRWSKSITPRVSGIIPLSLATYVSVLRSAYSLFAVLSTKH